MERYRRIEQKQRNRDKHSRDKREKFRQLVQNRQHLTPEAQMKLLHHLHQHVDEYDTNREFDDIEEIERAMFRDVELETAELLSDKLMHAHQGSEEEKQVVSELMEIYIPGFVSKDPPGADATASRAAQQPDAELDAVEDIDHPVSPPLRREITEEYIYKKNEKQSRKCYKTTNISTNVSARQCTTHCASTWIDSPLLVRTWNGQIPSSTRSILARTDPS